MAEYRTWFAALIPLGAILGFVASWHAHVSGVVIVAWVIALAAGQQIEIPTGSGERLFLGVAVGVASMMALDDPWAVAAVLAFGSVAAVLLSSFRFADVRSATSIFVSEVYAMGAFLAASFPILRLLRGTAMDPGYAALVAILTGGVAWFLVRTTARAFTGSLSSILSIRYVWMRSLRNWPSVVALFTSGALFGLLLPTFGWWTVPAGILNFGVAYLALRRYHESEIAYRQTIRAFSGIIEVAGFSASGHAAGTADIAAGMSRLVGLAPGRVDRLEQAALLHDVGLITLSDPGVASAGHTDEDIAAWGAAIIAEADELGDVADIVRSHARQYRQRGEETDRTVSTEARFLKAASAYDRTIRSQGASPAEALEFLHLNTSYDFDPEALRVLRRFLVGRGELADTS